MNGAHAANGGPIAKSLLWVSGAVLVPIVLTVFGHLFNTTYQGAQRLSALEAEFREIKNNLERMDAKLDRLLEAKR